MQYATLRLSKENDHTDYFDLKYKLIQNNFTSKWIQCVLEAQQKQYNISEPWAMYNINNRLNAEFLLEKMNDLISKIDKEEMLFGFKLESIEDQDKLNFIHSIFEKHHGQLDQWKINPIFQGKTKEFRKNLSQINTIVHACESTGTTPKIRIVWYDLPKYKKFEDSDYALFTNARKFGYLYHQYCDVGKNIESLAIDNDHHHHDLVPNIHFSADVVAHFWNDDNEAIQKREKQFKNYIEENKDYIKSQGYEKNDIRLTTGRIEIGRLENIDEIAIMEKLKNYNYIQSFNLT